MNAPAETKRQPLTAQAESVDWLTPPDEVANVILPVLERIDLDPCSHPNSYVPAETKHFGESIEDDGFLKDWSGKRVFINPPWGENWTKKMVEAYGPKPDTFHPLSMWVAKMIGEATVTAYEPASVLALLPAYVGNEWFHLHVVRSSAFCLLRGRIKFHRPDRTPGAAPGQAHQYVLWSREPDIVERFGSILSPRGLVVSPA